jgi:hypothetical protein
MALSFFFGLFWLAMRACTTLKLKESVLNKNKNKKNRMI